eukprot:TRINITY_DN3064_c0_g1_i1.p1 TRINITY_DN3064_c0_g1~~TRINITY_DN3064_c0_g1_i1.p1  ORF type:complete len:238 (+),score=45.84 TRINITY_DN3064_c0_g1_i1:85-798(+)
MDAQMACETESADSLHNLKPINGDPYIVHCLGHSVDGQFRYCITVTDGKNLAYYKAFNLHSLDSQRQQVSCRGWNEYFQAVRNGFMNELIRLTDRDDGDMEVVVPVKGEKVHWVLSICNEAVVRDVVTQVLLDLARGKSSAAYHRMQDKCDLLERQQRMAASGINTTAGTASTASASQSMSLSQSWSPVKETKRGGSDTTRPVAKKKKNVTSLNLLRPGQGRRKKEALKFGGDSDSE